MTTKAYTVTEGRTRFCEMVREAETVYDRYVLTRDGKPKAVLMSHEEYEGMLETIELERNPALVDDILKRGREYEEGKVKPVPARKIRLRKT